MKVIQRTKREKLKSKIKSRISGSPDVPRIAVYRSNKFVWIQAIDDEKGVTICSANDKVKPLGKGKIQKASNVGKEIAEGLSKLGIKKAVFDRGGFKYHGRVKAVAEGARGAGLEI